MDNFFSKIFWSIAISIFITLFLSVLAENPTLASSFAAFFGGFISFFVFQVLHFFLNKFLEKQLNFEDFSYIKQAFSIIHLHLISLLTTFFLLFISVSFAYIRIEGHPSPNIDLTNKITIENPFYWALRYIKLQNHFFSFNILF